MWLLYAFLAPAFYGVAEVLDNFMVNKEFRHSLTIVFYASIFRVVFLPVLLHYSPATIPPVSTWPLFICLGLVGVGYMYPYYKGLHSDETSVAISFLALERLFVPVFAFMLVGEVLAVRQYVGIVLAVLSVALLGLHHARAKLRLSKAVWYISLAALMLALEGVFLKLLYDKGVTVGTSILVESTLTLAFALCLLLVRKVRLDVAKTFSLFLKISPIFFLEDGFTLLGQYSENSAIAASSVSVVKGITMASPFFILIYAIVGHSAFPKLFKENLHRKSVARKFLLFCLLIFGIVLIT